MHRRQKYSWLACFVGVVVVISGLVGASGCNNKCPGMRSPLLAEAKKLRVEIFDDDDLDCDGPSLTTARAPDRTFDIDVTDALPLRPDNERHVLLVTAYRDRLFAEPFARGCAEMDARAKPGCADITLERVSIADASVQDAFTPADMNPPCDGGCCLRDHFNGLDAQPYLSDCGDKPPSDLINQAANFWSSTQATDPVICSGATSTCREKNGKCACWSTNGQTHRVHLSSDLDCSCPRLNGNHDIDWN